MGSRQSLDCDCAAQSIVTFVAHELFSQAGWRLLPIAGELQGALADGGAEGLVGGDGVEPCGLRFVVVSQEVNQTQRLTLRSQRQSLATTKAITA